MKIYLIILFQLMVFGVIGQSVSYRTLTTDDGLPSNLIYQIQQDQEGFIWITTDNGIVRYDGRKFKVYNNENIKDKDIIGLLIDDENTIWFWNLRGQLFYIKNNKVHLASFIKKDDKLVEFKQDKKGDYWYFLQDGKLHHKLYKVNKNHKPILIQNQSNLESRIYANLIITDDNYAVATTVGLHNYYFKGDKYVKQLDFDLYHNAIFKSKYINNKYWSIKKEFDEFYIVFEEQKRTSNFQKFEDKPFEIFNLFSDKDNNYWVITDNNILIIDSTEQELVKKVKLPNHKKINQFLHDKEGNYWLSIYGYGLVIMPSLDLKYSKIITDESTFVSALNVINNDLFIGYSNGKITIQSLEKETSTHFSLNTDLPIKGFFVDEHKDIWIYNQTYLYRMNPNNVISSHNAIANITYKTLYAEKDKLFIGNTAGVVLIPKNQIDILKYEGWGNIQKKAIEGIGKRVFSIEKVGQEYWFGSENGLYHYDGKKARLTTIKTLNESSITKIHNQNDTIWVGTQTNGIFQIVNNKIIKTYNRKNGLVSNNCQIFILEPNGMLWIGTNRGVNKVNTTTNEIDLIDKLDGLLSNDILALAVDKQQIYVSTSKGINSFGKNIQTKNTVAPPIYFSSFQIFEQDTILAEQYVLKHNQNNIRIGFTGVSFRSQGQFKYKYRMRGLSDDWREIQSDVVSYPVLNPENYTFEAVAINEDNIESQKPIRINITILKPFWATWTFRLFVLITFLLIVWIVMKARVNRIRERLKLKNEFEQKLNELEMRALQAQMNPHFIFNVLNSIQHYLTLNDGEQAMIYLSKFAKLIRMIFDFSRKSAISLYEEINFLKLYIEMERLRFKQKIEVNLTIDEEIFEDAVQVPPLLIQPIVENCFKHGLLHKENDGQIKIDFILKDNRIICVIEDNGVGREAVKKLKKWKKKTHKSAGLNTTKERLELWITKNSKATPKDVFKIIDLKDENGQAIGTRIELLLIQDINLT
ncbi:MAG: histidine kinase [Saprospiraceae bacterium]